MENRMKVDLEELNKQKREQILNYGKYVEISIIISGDKQMSPVCGCTCKNVSSVEIAKAVKCMQSMEEAIYRKEPSIRMLVTCIEDRHVTYQQDLKNNTVTKL